MNSVAHNAASAAFGDPRFGILQEDEYPKLEYHISVLTSPKSVGSHHDIVLGRDGVILRLGAARSVFLPEVATDQGWDLQTTLEYLSRKAGLDRDAWQEAELSVFQTISFGE